MITLDAPYRLGDDEDRKRLIGWCTVEDEQNPSVSVTVGGVPIVFRLVDRPDVRAVCPYLKTRGIRAELDFAAIYGSPEARYDADNFVVRIDVRSDSEAQWFEYAVTPGWIEKVFPPGRRPVAAANSASESWRCAGDDFRLVNEDQQRGQPFALALPGATMREASSIADLASWYAIGEAWVQIASRFMPAAPAVLDIGCSCGKMARFFVLNPGLRYVGLDVFRPAIDWCRREFAAHADRFRFEHLDVRSSLYNPAGALDPDTVALPVADGSIDMVMCASLFTHLLEGAFKHYLAEVERCLAPEGRALISILTAADRFAGDETKIEVSEAYFAELVGAAGLRVEQRIGTVYGQQVYLLAKSPSDR
jgi:SAM-dependent methyltransferase